VRLVLFGVLGLALVPHLQRASQVRVAIDVLRQSLDRYPRCILIKYI